MSAHLSFFCGPLSPITRFRFHQNGEPARFAGSAIFAGIATAGRRLHARPAWVDELNLATPVREYGVVTRETSRDGRKLSAAAKTFERGFGTHAECWLDINFGGRTRIPSARVGIGDEVKGKQGVGKILAASRLVAKRGRSRSQRTELCTRNSLAYRSRRCE
jgi:hypothetical protein